MGAKKLTQTQIKGSRVHTAFIDDLNEKMKNPLPEKKKLFTLWIEDKKLI